MTLTQGIAALSLAISVALPFWTALVGRRLAQRKELSDPERLARLGAMQVRVLKGGLCACVVGGNFLFTLFREIQAQAPGVFTLVWAALALGTTAWMYGGVLWVVREREQEWRGVTYSRVVLFKETLRIAVTYTFLVGFVTLGLDTFASRQGILGARVGEVLGDLFPAAFMSYWLWAPPCGAIKRNGPPLEDGPLLQGIRAVAERWSLPLTEVAVEDTHGAMRVHALPLVGGGLSLSDGLVKRVPASDGVTLACMGLAQMESRERWQKTSKDRGSFILCAWLALASFSAWVAALPHHGRGISSSEFLGIAIIWGSLLLAIPAMLRMRRAVSSYYRRAAELCGGPEVYLRAMVRANLPTSTDPDQRSPGLTTVGKKGLQSAASAMSVPAASLDALIAEVCQEQDEAAGTESVVPACTPSN